MRSDLRLPAAVAVTVLFASSAYAGIGAALESYAPGPLALLRMLAASAALAVWAVVYRVRLPEVRDMPAIVLAGLLAFALYNVALGYGQRTTTAGSASLLIASIPIFTALLAAAFLGERIGARGWVGIVVGFFGVAMISVGEGGALALDPGTLLVLLAAVSASGYFVFQKPYLEKYGSLTFTAYAVWAGMLLLLPFSPQAAATAPRASLEATVSVVYLGVFPTAVAYATAAYVFSRLPASRAVTLEYLFPPVAIAIAWVWLGEIPDTLAVLGGAVALAGVALVNRQKEG